MVGNKYVINRSINLDSPSKVLGYYYEVFERVIIDIVRLYSIYYHLSMNNKTSISFDYYNLTLINLRKLFEPKMKNKINVSLEIKDFSLPNHDYQLNFIQWINKFYTVFNSKEIENDYNKANIKRIKKTIEDLKKTFREFEQIYSDNEVEFDGISSIHPLKTRIVNYASKYVAHSIEKSMIEKWEYNNKVFPREEEIKNLVDLISRMDDNYRNFTYYWNNLAEMPVHDYSEDLETKMKRNFETWYLDLKL